MLKAMLTNKANERKGVLSYAYLLYKKYAVTIPKKKGNMVLVWLIKIVSFSFCLTSVIFNSIPIANINKIKPNWLNIFMFCSESKGNRKAETDGKRCPNTEGPKTIPATISPITVGCCILANNQPNKRQVIRMTMICNKRIPMEDSTWCISKSLKTKKPSLRSWGASFDTLIASCICRASPSLIMKYINPPNTSNITR